MEEQARIRIGSSITPANFFLPEILAQWERCCPHTPIAVQVDNAQNIEALLKRHEIDAGLVEGILQPDAAYETIPILSYPLTVICSPKHLLAGRKTISLRELSLEKLLLREKGSAIRDILDGALLLEGLSVEPVWTSVNSQALIQAVKQNCGLSILPRILVEQELRDGSLAELSVKQPELSCICHLTYAKGKTITPPLQTFLELVLARQEKEEAPSQEKGSSSC